MASAPTSRIEARELRVSKTQKTAADIKAGSNSAAQKLADLVRRIETLEEEKKAINGDIGDIYQEVKLGGFNPKVMRLLIRKRAREQVEVEEEEALLHTYEHALGT